MQASKWEINMADGCGVDSQRDCLSARFVTGSRVAGIDCGVVAVNVPAQTGMEFRIREGTCARYYGTT
jgi:hypothetical protein